jgi:hypothetical protein
VQYFTVCRHRGEVQGFLRSRALPAAELLRWLEERR